MLAIRVSIGRNIGSEPMADDQWADFIVDTASAIDIACQGPHHVELHQGSGIWDLAPEESAILSTFTTSADVDALRARLANLAATYRQDAIGLQASPSELIGAARVVAA